MTKDVNGRSSASIDPAFVAAIVREVIARLKTNPSSDMTPQPVAPSADQRLITVADIERLSGNPKELIISPNAVVTPAARDEARDRGITIHRSIPATRPTNQHANIEIIDDAQPSRADLVRAQLARRGVGGTAKVILSDTPSRDVYQMCATQGEVSVMITALADVQRFAAELAPTVWVLDMKRINIPTAVNAIARIAQLGS